MIHIDRGRVSRPLILEPSSYAELARGKAMEFFRRPFEDRAQERFEFDLGVFRDPILGEALDELFYRKCAFCESKAGQYLSVDVGHYRPMIRTIGLDGVLFPDHYWWLAYEWPNLYLICATCEKMRGSRFPIRGPRAEPGAGWSQLLAEEPLLLDPCEDDPEEHLVFGEDGTVASDTERGRVTIEVFGLNRKELVAAREREYRGLREAWESLQPYLERGEPAPEELSPDALADPSQRYAGMRNQFLAEWLGSAPTPIRGRLEEPEWESFAKGVSETRKGVLSQEARQETFDKFQAYQRVQEDYSLEERVHEERYFLRTRMIERIEIRNFKVIQELDLHLSSGQGERAPWLMLLGENGTGKSSALQAVALALVGDRYRAMLPVEPRDVLRYGCEQGSVRVFLTGGTAPIELTFRQGATQFEANWPEPKVLLLAYGATRLLPRAGVQPATGTEYARVDNLFNPFVPLKNATEWLLELPEESFQHIARALKDLLALEDRDRLVRQASGSPRVEVEAFGTTVPLEQLSDGYQSVLALTTDVMAVMLERWQAMDVAEGIVLLDEIGAHLHPRWKMRIVKSLRQVFPRVQFIVTTHNPLCLRGLLEGEVVVMRRGPDDRIVALTDLPPVDGLRVDQLLTSEHFGLDSTIDPEIDAMFQEYYRLLAARERSPTEEERLVELKAHLENLDLMGTTRRERLALEAVDQYLAAEPELLDLEKRRALKEETRSKVAEIWSRLERKEGD